MKYFFDTEFIEDGLTIDLISIGIVAEDGREYYAVNWECDLSAGNEWVQNNVVKYLPLTPTDNCKTRQIIAEDIVNFCHSEPEFWAYYCSYDWVVLCQLFGTMIELPRHFPMYCNDIKQLCNSLGNPRLYKQTQSQRYALYDAKWCKQAYEYLINLSHEKITS